jgi:hypothetical protein
VRMRHDISLCCDGATYLQRVGDCVAIDGPVVVEGASQGLPVAIQVCLHIGDWHPAKAHCTQCMDAFLQISVKLGYAVLIRAVNLKSAPAGTCL